MEDRTEQRTSPRRPADEGASAEVERHGAGSPIDEAIVQVVNVSEGGAKLSSAFPLAAGDHIRLVFPPRTDWGLPVTVTGDVVWTRAPAFRLLGRYSAGLAFSPALQTGAEDLMIRCGAGPATRPPVD